MIYDEIGFIKKFTSYNTRFGVLKSDERSFRLIDDQCTLLMFYSEDKREVEDRFISVQNDWSSTEIDGEPPFVPTTNDLWSGIYDLNAFVIGVVLDNGYSLANSEMMPYVLVLAMATLTVIAKLFDLSDQLENHELEVSGFQSMYG